MASVWSDWLHLSVAIKLHVVLTALPGDFRDSIDYLNRQGRGIISLYGLAIDQKKGQIFTNFHS